MSQGASTDVYRLTGFSPVATPLEITLYLLFAELTFDIRLFLLLQ